MPSAPPRSTQVVTVRGERELMDRAGHLLTPEHELLCAAKDMSTWSRPGSREAILTLLRPEMAAGVSIRKLYNPEVLVAQGDREHLAEAGARGVRVRICAGPLAHQTIIVDGRVAILAGDLHDGVRTFSVVLAPEVVTGVRTLFLAGWTAATDLAEFLRAEPPAVNDEGMAILRLLSAGRKDESAAREIGLSLRTYRRRVAELLSQLGVESRFQAGVRARELGLRV
jgi:DNA-binding NarL/FixJ family response regulator